MSVFRKKAPKPKVRRVRYADYEKVVQAIAAAGRSLNTVKIYYPRTENTRAGWREVEPYSISMDPGSEHLIYGEDRISPGHILNGYTVDSLDDHCDSFILGKIKGIKGTRNKFIPRNGWRVEF